MRLLLAPLAYLLLALVGHLPALHRLTTATLCACRDAPQTDWFLAWTPYALSQGRAPWTTEHLAVPDGVNLMWNTLLPLPGLLAAPVTLTAGPLAAHTLLLVAGFAGSATAMWFVAGRFATWPWARFAAGLLYGFSPHLVAQGTGHLNLVLVALPPLVLLLAHELLVRQRRRPLVAGALLGLVAFAQLMTTEEVLASTFVVAVVGLLVLVVQRRREVRAHARHAALGLTTAALLLTALAAWPLLVQFTGERALTAPAQDPSRYAADLLGTVVPTVHQLLGTDATLTWGGNDSENGSYLGPLALVLLVLAVRLRDVAVVRWAAVTAALVWLLSLGERLHVAGTETDLPLPFAGIAALPVLESMAAVRLSLYVVLLSALVLAVALDRLHASGALSRHRLRAGALVALCVVPLLPAWPYEFVDAGTPEYFASEAVERVPEGSVALTYPVPRFPSSAPMLWQAEAGFRYRSVGGYVITPDEKGAGTFRGGITDWERVVSQAPIGRLGPVAPQVVDALREEMAELDVRSVLVADVPGAEAVVAVVVQVLGPPDEAVGGVTAWYR